MCECCIDDKTCDCECTTLEIRRGKKVCLVCGHEVSDFCKVATMIMDNR